MNLRNNIEKNLDSTEMPIQSEGTQTSTELSVEEAIALLQTELEKDQQQNVEDDSVFNYTTYQISLIDPPLPDEMVNLPVAVPLDNEPENKNEPLLTWPPELEATKAANFSFKALPNKMLDAIAKRSSLKKPIGIISCKLDAKKEFYQLNFNKRFIELLQDGVIQSINNAFERGELPIYSDYLASSPILFESPSTEGRKVITQEQQEHWFFKKRKNSQVSEQSFPSITPQNLADIQSQKRQKLVVPNISLPKDFRPFFPNQKEIEQEAPFLPWPLSENDVNKLKNGLFWTDKNRTLEEIKQNKGGRKKNPYGINTIKEKDGRYLVHINKVKYLDHLKNSAVHQNPPTTLSTSQALNK